MKNVKMCLLDADYVIENGKAIIRLFGVDEKGKSVIVFDKYQPYFYVLPKNKTKIIEKLKKNKMVVGIDTVRKKIGLEEKEFLKVYVNIPPNVPKVRDAIKNSPFVKECYEYTTNFYKRYLIDKKFYPLSWLSIKGNDVKEKFNFDVAIKANSIKVLSQNKTPKLKLMAFDIEVVDNKIIMISLADNRGFKKVLTYKKAKSKNCKVLKNEKEMLAEFEKTINERNPDIILTYNGDQYDFEVLRERTNENKIDMKISRDTSSLKFARRARVSSARLFGRVHIDLFNFVNNIISPQLQSEVFTLAEVSREILGEGKEELSFEEIIDLWNNDEIEKLVDYCQNDSVLTLKLGEKLLPDIFELSKVSGQLPFDCSRLTYGLLVEWFLVRKAFEKNYVCPNQPHWDEIQKRRKKKPYKGGYVKEPVVGLHDDIAVFDFRSLYPSIIVTFNISPETLNCKCCKGNAYKVPELKYYFCKKHNGFISSVVKELIEKRMQIKKMMKKAKGEILERLDREQKAVKIIANASYGMLAYSGARWYCYECAESAAAFGRDNIKKTIVAAEKFGFDVLYCDTDSLFVKSKKGSINKKANEFLKYINQKLPGILELDLQGIYTRGLFVPQKLGAYTAKKRYALLDRNGNLIVRGMEAVRSDWCNLAKNLQHNILKLVLKKKEKQAVKLVKDTVRKLKARKIDLRDIAITTQLGKELEEYKALAPHIAVAKMLEKDGHEIRPGVIISYIVTKGKGKISERAKPIDKVNKSDYDTEYYIKNQIISVALRVLSVLGYKEDDFLGNGLKKYL